MNSELVTFYLFDKSILLNIYEPDLSYIAGIHRLDGTHCYPCITKNIVGETKVETNNDIKIC